MVLPIVSGLCYDVLSASLLFAHRDVHDARCEYGEECCRHCYHSENFHNLLSFLLNCFLAAYLTGFMPLHIYCFSFCCFAAIALDYFFISSFLPRYIACAIVTTNTNANTNPNATIIFFTFLYFKGLSFVATPIHYYLCYPLFYRCKVTLFLPGAQAV